MRDILDAETVSDIMAQFEFSSTGKHLSEEQNAIAAALLQELQKRIAATTDSDEQMTIAREARAAWHKAVAHRLSAVASAVGSQVL
jgi:hypothetical protein